MRTPLHLRAVWQSSLLLLGFLALPACAQLPASVLSEVTPSGGQLGSTFEVKLTGTDLDGCTALIFSSPKLTAKPVLITQYGQSVPANDRFIVTVAADAPVGIHEVRAVTRFGVSNPRRFHLGTLPEITEAEKNNTPEEASEIEIGSVINGASNARGDIDYFRFDGKSGQRLIVDCLALSIDSRFEGSLELRDQNGRLVSNALGDFQNDPVLDATLPSDGTYSLKVHDIAFNYESKTSGMHYRLRVHTGPHLDFVLPPAGRPGKVETFTIYGRNLPNGTKTDVVINGITLEKVEQKIPVPDRKSGIDGSAVLPLAASDADGFTWSMNSPGGSSNSVLIHISNSVPIDEKEPNDELAGGQSITLPAHVYGTTGRVGDRDGYVFDAKKDDVWMIEVFGQRLGHPIDPFLTIEQLTEADGKWTAKAIKTADDNGQAFRANVFESVSDDPSLEFKAPADGRYRVVVVDRFGSARGGADAIYRLQIRKPVPDFRVVAIPSDKDPKNGNSVVPSAVTLRKGGSATIPVYVFRKDGFAGAVTVSASGLPEGVTSQGAVIAPGSNTASVIVSCRPDTAVSYSAFELTAEAEVQIDGKPVTQTHSVRPMAVTWGAGRNGFPPQTRLSQQLTVGVVDRVLPWTLSTDVTTRFTVNQGRQILIPLKLERQAGFDEPVKLTLVDVPKNSNIQGPSNLTIEKGKTEAILRLFVNTNAKEGTSSFAVQTESKFLKFIRNPDLVSDAKDVQSRVTKYLEDAQKELNAAKAGSTSAAADVKKLQAELTAAQQNKTVAEQKLKAAMGDQKKIAEDELKAAVATLQKAEAAQKSAQQKQQETAELVKKLDANVKAIQKQKQAEDKKVQDAEKDKGKDITIQVASIPIAITVQKSPVNLSATVPSGGMLKMGQELKIKVRVSRNKDFKEAVKLALATPPGVNGLSAAAVTVPVDQKEAELTIKAAADATEGAIANLVIRASMPYQGRAEVDIPIAVTISK